MQILVEEAKSVPCWGKNGPKILIVAPAPIEEGVIYPDFNEKSVETTRALAREYAFLAVAKRVDFLDAGGCELTKAYNKDMQEDKEGVFDSVRTASTSFVHSITLKN